MKVKLSQLYEEMAQHLGYKDWNTCAALLPPGNLDDIKSKVRYIWKHQLDKELSDEISDDAT